MRKNALSAFAVLALALAGCHIRAIPFSSPPGYSLSHESADGTLNKKQDATLSDEDNHYMQGFRYGYLGYASAMAVVLFVVAFAIILIMLKRGRTFTGGES